MKTSLYAFHFSMSGFNGSIGYCPQTLIVSATSYEEAKTRIISLLKEKGNPGIADFSGPYAPCLHASEKNFYSERSMETGKTALETLIEMVQERGLINLHADAVFFSALDG